MAWANAPKTSRPSIRKITAQRWRTRLRTGCRVTSNPVARNARPAGLAAGIEIAHPARQRLVLRGRDYFGERLRRFILTELERGIDAAHVRAERHDVTHDAAVALAHLRDRPWLTTIAFHLLGQLAQ